MKIHICFNTKHTLYLFTSGGGHAHINDQSSQSKIYIYLFLFYTIYYYN